jgi:hypothetical protein
MAVLNQKVGLSFVQQLLIQRDVPLTTATVQQGKVIR